MAIEQTTEDDALTGIPVTRLTAYRGHSHHLYFTNPGWYDRGRRMLFASDRCNRGNLFAIHLADGDIEPVTDLDEAERSFLSACVDPVRDVVYFRDGDDLVAFDLAARRGQAIHRFDPRFHLHMMNVSADGSYVYFGVFADPDRSIRAAVDRGGADFAAIWASRPLSRILRVPAGGGDAETIHEDRRWIGHVNTSPTRPDWLTFCHEGPWEKVGQRLWAMDVGTGRIRPLRPVAGRETIGHEYWYADGERIGYHGRAPDGLPLMGRVHFDGSGRCDAAFPVGGETGHIHSNDERLVVGDGDGLVKLWRLEPDGGYSAPRALCTHRTGQRFQIAHAHPRFSPDGRYVVFTSDRSGYANVYRVPAPDFGGLKECHTLSMP